MIPRHIVPRILEALHDTPVVFVQGARQSGKTTLVQSLVGPAWPARYVTLDDVTTLAAAAGDPTGFVAGFEGPVIIDEVQKAPGLFPAIKQQVDRARRPGRYLLTGSANVLLVPKVSESLAGRIEIQTLWPLSQGEIDGLREGFVDGVFSRNLPSLVGKPMLMSNLLGRVLTGGYPELVTSRKASRRDAWFKSYMSTILQRDVRELAEIQGLTELPRLLTLLATRAGGLLNSSDIARDLAIPLTTLKRYFALLEVTFLVQPLPAWSSNLGKRLVKAPKLYLGDTGLLAHLVGYGKGRLPVDRTQLGHLLENFAVMELRKQAFWSRTQPELFHYRTQTGQEVDVVLEDRSGRLVGIEIKAAAALSAGDVKGLRAMAQTLGDRFHRGILLYAGQETIPFAHNIHALPIAALWLMGAMPRSGRSHGHRRRPR
jgi:predicted AAA+ superfamily ATPase